jgi:hypothetical protein
MTIRSPFTGDRRQLAQAAGIAVLYAVDSYQVSHAACNGVRLGVAVGALGRRRSRSN